MRRTYVRRSSETIAATPQLVSFCDAIKYAEPLLRKVLKAEQRQQARTDGGAKKLESLFQQTLSQMI